MEQTDPGVDTNPDAENVEQEEAEMGALPANQTEQEEAEVGVLPANQSVNEIPALPVPSPVPQDRQNRRYPRRDRRPPQLYGQPFFI